LLFVGWLFEVEVVVDWCDLLVVLTLSFSGLFRGESMSNVFALQDSAIHAICVGVVGELKRFISDSFNKQEARKGYRWRKYTKNKIRKSNEELNEKFCDIEDEYQKEVFSLKVLLKGKTDEVKILSNEVKNKMNEDRILSNEVKMKTDEVNLLNNEVKKKSDEVLTLSNTVKEKNRQGKIFEQ